MGVKRRGQKSVLATKKQGGFAIDKLSKSFDKSAGDYLKSRSEYPIELIKYIIEAANLRSDSQILEVGCGSGQATIEFAARGYNIIAIDPAKQALELLAERCQKFPNVSLQQATFETFESPDSVFDLIISAQAFHWVEPTVVAKKMYPLLRPSGHVMLFWHMQDVEIGSPQAQLQALNSRYFDSYPTMNPPEYSREFLDAMIQILCQDPRIREPLVKEYIWERTYERADFLSLYRSWSRYAILSDSVKEQIEEDLEKHLDSLFSKPATQYRTCLIHAHC